MNVIIDTSTLHQEMSGTGYYTLGMLRELLKMDSVDVVQTLGGSKKLLQELDNGKMVRHFENETRWHRLLNVTMAGNRPGVNGDIALFPNYFMPPGFPLPSLVTVHDLTFLSDPHFYSKKMHTFYRHRIRHTFANAAQILTVSEASRKQILQYSNRDQNQVIPISPGPSLPKNHPNLPTQANFKYFLWNGNIEPRKNVIPTIKAFLASQAGRYKLVLAGKRFCGNRYWREFVRLVEQSDRVYYLGYVDNPELKQWYAHSKGVIYCSFAEGFGIPAANARAMHKPCLISNLPALQEAAGPKVVTVNATDTSDISRGFNELIKPYMQETPKAEYDAYPLEHDVQWSYFSVRLEEILQKSAFDSKNSTSVSYSQPRLSDIKKSILNTLAYSAVFEAPIRVKDCHRELQHFGCSYQQFNRALVELAIDFPGTVMLKNEFVGLKPYTESLEEYQQQFTENSRFIDKHQPFIKIIRKIPWMEGLYFSGGTVHATHRGTPDLDLFVLTKKNRTWLVYTLLKLFSFFSRSRDFLCFNYLIDTDNVQVQTQQDLYTAHQILHLKPAIDTPSQPDIKAANPWIYDYFPNSRPDNFENREESPKAAGTTRQNVIMEALNLLLMSIWGWFWRKKGVKNRTGGIRWDAHQVKLHTHDHRPWVFRQYHNIQANINRRINEAEESEASYPVNDVSGAIS